MAAQPEAVEQVIEPSPYAMWGEDCGLGRRIEPGGDFDGFYYLKLAKVP